MPTTLKQYFKDVWILPVCYLIAILGLLRSPFRVFVGNVLGVPDHGDSPTRYLQEYVADGVSSGIALLLILVLASLTWKRYPLWTLLTIFTTWVMLASPIAYAVALLWRSLNVVDAKQAESLLRDRSLEGWTHYAGFWSGVAVMTTLSFVLWWFGKTRFGGESTTSPGDSVS